METICIPNILINFVLLLFGLINSCCLIKVISYTSLKIPKSQSHSAAIKDCSMGLTRMLQSDFPPEIFFNYNSHHPYDCPRCLELLEVLV